MDILKNYARTTHKEPTEVTSVRIPKSLHKNFKKHCEQYGLGIAEAINILIRNELGETHKQSDYEDVSNKLQKQLHKESPVKSSSPQKVVSKSPQSKQTERFNATEFAVKGELPCPLCGFWLSQANFARHSKRVHSLSKKDIFTNHREEAIEMLKKRNTTES